MSRTMQAAVVHSFGQPLIIEVQPLSAINQVFGRLKHGEVQGRVVLQIA